MKHRILKFTLGAVCAGLAGQAALSAPLRRADVSANPVWVLHLDCDALRPTAIGQFILSEMDKEGGDSKLAAFEAIFGVDPRSQLHGVTAYSGASKPEEGVLLVYADFDPKRLVTLAQAAHDYDSTKHNKHVIHSWIDEKKQAKNGVRPRTYAAIDGSCVLFGQHEEVVAAALDVMDGAATNLETSKAYPELSASGGGRIIQAAARKMDFGGSDPKATLFKMSKEVWLEASDTGHQVNATLHLEADDDDVASSINAVAQGLVALVKLQAEKQDSKPVKGDAARLLAKSLTLKQDGASVVAGLSLPEDQVIDFVKTSQARKDRKKAQGLEDN
jgi:hypothetical protein